MAVSAFTQMMPKYTKMRHGATNPYGSSFSALGSNTHARGAAGASSPRHPPLIRGAMTSKAVVSIFANAHASHSALNARYDPVTQSAVERVSNEAMRDPQAMSSEAVESAVSTMPTPTAMLDDPANSGEAASRPLPSKPTAAQAKGSVRLRSSASCTRRRASIRMAATRTNAIVYTMWYAEISATGAVCDVKTSDRG